MKAGIAGAGLMGRLLAFLLVNAGWKVTLFDRTADTATDNCSFAAAGLLTPIAELEKSELIIYELGMAALEQHWPALLNQLAAPIFFQQQGSLLLAHPRELAELTHFIQRINSKLHSTATTYRPLNAAEVTSYEPELTHIQTAYYFPQEGLLDNQTLLQKLADYLHQHNITWHTATEVTEVKAKQIILDRQIQHFDMVFDCRGLGAKSSFADLRGIRGEAIWLHAPEVHIQHPLRLLHPRYSLYIVPRPNQTYIIGATEIEAEDTNPISVRSTLELLTAAYYVHPSFAEARIIKTVTQCRPTLAHHLPQIKYQEGYIAVNGLYRHGFLVGPSIASDIMQYLQHGINTVSYPQLWEKL